MDSSEVSSSANLSTDAPLVAPLQEDKLEKQKEEEAAAAANMVPRRRSLNSSTSAGRRFLGVRQRPSGRWVAEIKDSSQKLRLWLGTFDRPEYAALAYDTAARLLRGKNAKTNFSCPPDQFSKRNTHHEGIMGCSFLGKNPRAYHLLQHAVMKNRALCSTILPWKNQSTTIDEQDYDTLVEETVVCSSSSDEGGPGRGCSELSFGSSKVYSSVIVAPSFSSSSCQTRE